MKAKQILSGTGRQAKRAWRAAATHIDARDLVFGAGLIVLGAGCSQVYPPAGVIVVGAVLTAVGIFGVRN